MRKKTKTAGLNHKKSKKPFRPMFFLFTFFLTCIFSSYTWHLYKLNEDVNVRIYSLGQEKASLLKEKSQLEADIVKLNTPSYIEQLAREQLGLVKQGEIMIAPKKDK